MHSYRDCLLVNKQDVESSVAKSTDTDAMRVHKMKKKLSEPKL